MQLVANQKLIRNRGRVGAGLYVVAMGILVVGYLRSLQYRDESTDLQLDSWLAISLGVVLWAAAMSQINRWGPNKRAEGALARAIRSLDDRYKLYAFISSALPDYILTGPSGVSVVVPRPQGGVISCESGRWRRHGANILLGFFGASLGNPSLDAERALVRVRALLAAEEMADVPTSAFVVFTHPRVQLKNQCSGATVTRLSELKHVLQRAAKGRDTTLTPARLRAVQQMLDQRLERAGSWR